MTGTRWVGLAGLTLICMAARGTEVLHDFPNASLGAYEWQDEETLELSYERDSFLSWFHFRLDDAQDQPHRFVFPSLPETILQSHVPIVYSYDQRYWAWMPHRTGTINPGGSVRLEYAHTSSQNRMWVAETPPYTHQMLSDLIRRATDHPHVTIQTVAESTLESIPITLFRIHDPESVAEHQPVFVLAREQAWESAGSWVAQGMIDFLIGDSPVAAALRRRYTFHILPMMDVEGVQQGTAHFPFPYHEQSTRWNRTWDERRFSFHEQRAVKTWLRRVSQETGAPVLALSLGAVDAGNEFMAFARREVPEELAAALQQSSLPWLRLKTMSVVPGSWFSVVTEMAPEVIPLQVYTSWQFNQTLHPEYPLLKTTEDVRIEGELLLHALAQWSRIEASDPPPMLHSAMIPQLNAAPGQALSIQCVYRDLRNRPPVHVHCRINDEVIELRKADAADTDYTAGVLYVGTVTVEAESAQHVFEASNGSQTTRSPRRGAWPGPYRIAP